jgi:signal transduction histidine kinase
MSSAERAVVEPPLILVVDDDEDTRQNLADILELDGYRVAQAATARELLAHRDWKEVAVVLLDRKLPDGNPQQLAPQIKELAPFAAIIIVTGYADVEGAINAVRSGATDYILKPVNADVLLASIRRAVKHQQAEREIARLHEDLAQSEVRYRALFDSTLDGLLIFNDRHQAVAANRAAYAMLALPVGSLIDEPFESLALRNSNRPERLSWQECFAPRDRETECSYEANDHSAMALEYLAVRNFFPGLHLLSLRDVTTRKQAEERALQSERLAAIGETMAALVHESRNALQRSKACLEMLTLDLEDKPAALQLVARAQRAQDDLHRLYEEVRQWAAPVKLNFAPCNLQQLWSEVWNEVCEARQQQSVKLCEDVQDIPVCDVDEFAMAHVFRNILENAMDVSSSGKEITVRCKSFEARGENLLWIAFEDCGPGLKPEQIQRMFEPFFTTKSKGTGLGMAIAQRIVQAHGGSIQASSPAGARIEILLPRKHT